MGTSDIEIAMERNEPNASSRSGWFPESEAGDTKGTDPVVGRIILECWQT